MAWIEIHQALKDHRKTQALAVRLDLPEPHVIGHLVYLWLWALDNAPDGRLPDSARIIARAAWWDGDGDTWVASLRECGWIDVDEDGDVRLHDWDAYGGKLCDQRRASADRQKRFRERRQGTTDSATVSPNRKTVTLPLCNALENTTQHNTTVTTPSVSPPAAAVPSEVVETAVPKIRSVPKPIQARIPDDFEVSDEMAAFAEKIGLPRPMVETETDKFLDHFRAKGERKTDWVAAWRNWMRRVGEFQLAPARPRPMSGNRTAAPSNGVVGRSDGAAQRRLIGRD